MLNTIIRSIAFLVGLGTKAVAALAQFGSTLNLPHTEEADIPAKMTAANIANLAHKEALIIMGNKRLALLAAMRTGRRFMSIVRENLKPVLGADYSVQWTAIGFIGNLSVPRAAEPLLTALQLIEGYLTAHPIADGGPSLAAARAGVLRTALATAIAGVAAQKEVVDTALTTRDEKAAELEQALRTLLSELHQVLDPMDARWLAFGFLKPGQKQSPDRPGKVSVTLIGPNAASVKWAKAARAEYYRVWKKVIGVDEDYVAVGSPADLDFTIENLPAGSQIEVVVTAVNNGGETAFSAVAMVVTL